MRLLFVGLMVCWPAVLLATPCVPGSLQSYVNLGATGCEIGDRVFSNFTIEGQTPPFPKLDPALVRVTPGGSPSQPALDFAVDRAVTGGESVGLLFQFEVGGPLTYAAAHFQTPAVTSDGQVTIFVDFCPGGVFNPYFPDCTSSPSTIRTASAYHSETYGSYEHPSFLPDATSYDVSVHLYLEGRSGTASLDSATIVLNTVPEPTTRVLLLTGLGAGWLRRRRGNRGRIGGRA